MYKNGTRRCAIFVKIYRDIVLIFTAGFSIIDIQNDISHVLRIRIELYELSFFALCRRVQLPLQVFSASRFIADGEAV